MAKDIKKIENNQPEIDNKVNKYQMNQKNWFMKHKIITVILILFVIGIFSSGSNKDTKEAFEKGKQAGEKQILSPTPTIEMTPTPIPTKTARVNTNKTTPITPTPTLGNVSTTTTSGYQAIYDKYVARLRSECPSLSMTECAQVSNEGISEMAKHMYASKGVEGQYQTYSDWAGKLMDVYTQEAR